MLHLNYKSRSGMLARIFDDSNLTRVCLIVQDYSQPADACPLCACDPALTGKVKTLTANHSSSHAVSLRKNDRQTLPVAR